MKRTKLLFFIVSFLAFIASCDTSKSDPETESKIYGEWKNTTFDDDVMMSENVLFYADNTFKYEVGVFAMNFTPICHIKAKGTWSASKTTLTQIYDIRSIGSTYINSSAIDLGYVSQALNELRKELKEPQNSKIISIGPDSRGDICMTLESDEEEETWVRVETSQNADTSNSDED